MMTRPKDMSRYLLTIAATISVPPVEPLNDSPSPIPEPQKMAPMMLAMKGWSAKRCMLMALELKSEVRPVSNSTA